MLHRRDLIAVVSAWLAGSASGEDRALPSKVYKFEDLPVRTKGPNASRAFLDGETHTGMAFSLHETELAPGEIPHAAHHHEREEIVIVHEGTLEVTMDGQSTTVGPGSVAYMASNVEHGWRNVGKTRAKYYVLALGKG